MRVQVDFIFQHFNVVSVTFVLEICIFVLRRFRIGGGVGWKTLKGR